MAVAPTLTVLSLEVVAIEFASGDTTQRRRYSSCAWNSLTSCRFFASVPNNKYKNEIKNSKKITIMTMLPQPRGLP